ncbi:recombinase family protein [Streptomyces tritici]|uniref:recombinase family protein n=1 Tax=Streptomyces tritici TaxID=2054410 RepID=UPI003AF10BD1
MTPTSNSPLAGTVFAETLRGVRCIRLSVLTDETTSPERQREAGDIASAAHNISFGEGDQLREAVDLDVSASKVGPFDRPQLGAWLAKPDEFDALVWWRFDRAIRSMSDMHDLAKWARTHRKVLVFAEGLGGGPMVLDFRNPMDPMSELMMLMLAFAAQVEAQSISARVSGAQAALRAMPLRWAGGGAPPYGYMPVPMPEEHGGIGWTLVPDPDAVKVIERIIRECLDGTSLNQIAVALNAEGVPSPRDHWSIKKGRVKDGKVLDSRGRPRERSKWTGANIGKLLRNPVLIGWKMHRGKPVRTKSGEPVMITTAPILTREEFDRIGKVLDDRHHKVVFTARVDSRALLLGVIHCDGCGGRMYLRDSERVQARQAPFYICSPQSRGEVCPQPTNVRASWVDDYVTAEFLRRVGSVQTTTVVEIPGYDPEPELKATLAEFEEHQEQKGRQKSKHAARAWQERADALDARIAELEEREKVEPQRVVTHTGRTFADEWAGATTEERRAMLVEAGVRLDVRKGRAGGWRKLDTRRVDFTMSGELDPAAESVAVAAGDDEAVKRNEAPPAPGSSARLIETCQERVTVAA